MLLKVQLTTCPAISDSDFGGKVVRFYTGITTE